MVCATARRAPIRAYFEFEAQPDHIIEYTVKLEMAIKKRKPKLRFASGNGIGSGIQTDRANNRARVGARINSIGDEFIG